MLRKKIGSKLKAKIALEAIQSIETLSVIGSRYGVHGKQVSKWKKILQDRAEELFSDTRKLQQRDTADEISKLYEEIGRLKVENDFLKKKSGFSI